MARYDNEYYVTVHVIAESENEAKEQLEDFENDIVSIELHKEVFVSDEEENKEREMMKKMLDRMD